MFSILACVLDLVYLVSEHEGLLFYFMYLHLESSAINFLQKIKQWKPLIFFFYCICFVILKRLLTVFFIEVPVQWDDAVRNSHTYCDHLCIWTQYYWQILTIFETGRATKSGVCPLVIAIFWSCLNKWWNVALKKSGIVHFAFHSSLK